MTLTGALNTSGLVYCMVSKNGSSTPIAKRRILADNTTNDTTDTDPWALKLFWTLSQWKEEFNVMRA